ncbi:hypothetical protein [Neorhodopirellula lusitana]|nr:hypothetical protein [Neorhodopirellula lusitana]
MPDTTILDTPVPDIPMAALAVEVFGKTDVAAELAVQEGPRCRYRR